MGIKLASGPGGHPEIGDTVYKSNGEELGEIEFFYASMREDVWGVKVGTDPEDHGITVIQRVPAMDKDGNVVSGYGLVRLNEAFVDNNNKVGKPSIDIQNNVGIPLKLVIPVEIADQLPKEDGNV